MKTANHEIRGYQARDRDDVRRICCDAVQAGLPLSDDVFVDRELFADLWTSWFTDECPDSTWVVVSHTPLDGSVVGYLTGCEDTRRWLAWSRSAWPLALGRAASRGRLLRSDAAKFLIRNTRLLFAAGARAALSRPHSEAERFPAHLHINMTPHFRGAGVGRALIERFINRLRESRISGVHAVVGGDNQRAQAFFSREGFRVLARIPDLAFSAGPRPTRVLMGRAIVF
jgi:ribosomal protein S18 acetylase RimI-like enzyme